jgi:hypothetical protein
MTHESPITHNLRCLKNRNKINVFHFGLNFNIKITRSKINYESKLVKLQGHVQRVKILKVLVISANDIRESYNLAIYM